MYTCVYVLLFVLAVPKLEKFRVNFCMENFFVKIFLWFVATYGNQHMRCILYTNSCFFHFRGFSAP